MIYDLVVELAFELQQQDSHLITSSLRVKRDEVMIQKGSEVGREDIGKAVEQYVFISFDEKIWSFNDVFVHEILQRHIQPLWYFFKNSNGNFGLSFEPLVYQLLFFWLSLEILEEEFDGEL